MRGSNEISLINLPKQKSDDLYGKSHNGALLIETQSDHPIQVTIPTPYIYSCISNLIITDKEKNKIDAKFIVKYDINNGIYHVEITFSDSIKYNQLLLHWTCQKTNEKNFHSLIEGQNISYKNNLGENMFFHKNKVCIDKFKEILNKLRTNHHSYENDKRLLTLLEDSNSRNFAYNEIEALFLAIEKTFIAIDLTDEEKTASPIEWINIYLAKKGCCRHIAQVFFKLWNYFGFPCRFISNKVHQFLEVYDLHENQWKSFNTGLYTPCTNYEKAIENEEKLISYLSKPNESITLASLINELY